MLLSTTQMAWVHTVKENNLDLQISTYYLERITYTKVLGVIMQVGTKRKLCCPLWGYGHCSK